MGTHAPIYRHKPYITGISIKIGARFISPTYLPPSLPPSLTLSIYRAHRPLHSFFAPPKDEVITASLKHRAPRFLHSKAAAPTPRAYVLCFIPCGRSCQSCVWQWPSCGARCSFGNAWGPRNYRGPTRVVCF